MKFFSRLSCLFLILGCFTGHAYAQFATVNKIVAVVNGEMITLHELRARTAAEMAQDRIPFSEAAATARMQSSLDSMINDILLRQEAQRLKVTVTDMDLDPEIRRLVQRSKMSQKDFEARLVSQGSTMAALRDQIRNNILRQRIYAFMVARKITVSEEDVRRYYETNTSQFVSEKTVDFSVIVFSPSVNAESIYGQLKSNAISFEDAAQKYSVDVNAKKGGRVGSVPFDTLPPPMQQLFTKQLKPGQFTPLVRIDRNLGTIRLNSIANGGEVLPFEQVKGQVEDKLREPLVRERLGEYVKQLRGKAVIDIRL